MLHSEDDDKLCHTAAAESAEGGARATWGTISSGESGGCCRRPQFNGGHELRFSKHPAQSRAAATAVPHAAQMAGSKRSCSFPQHYSVNRVAPTRRPAAPQAPLSAEQLASVNAACAEAWPDCWVRCAHLPAHHASAAAVACSGAETGAVLSAQFGCIFDRLPGHFADLLFDFSIDLHASV